VRDIFIDGNAHKAKVEFENHHHGHCVVITVYDGNEKYFKSKVFCQYSDEFRYTKVTEMSSAARLDDAWRIFKQYYPFGKLTELADGGGGTIILYWRVDDQT